MRTFEVVVNRCTGDVHENEITCDNCKQKGSCAIICGRRVCQTCLDVACVAINRAVLNSFNAPPYEELPQQTFSGGKGETS